MTRWELVTSDDYIIANVECIIVSKKSVIKTRQELNEFFVKLKNELLHGEQKNGGCNNPNCKICYPYDHLKPKTISQ